MFRIVLFVVLFSGALSRGLQGVSEGSGDLKQGYRGSSDEGQGRACTDCHGNDKQPQDTTDDPTQGRLPLPSHGSKPSDSDKKSEVEVSEKELLDTIGHTTRRRQGRKRSHKKKAPFLRLSRIKVQVNSKQVKLIAKKDHVLDGSREDENEDGVLRNHANHDTNGDVAKLSKLSSTVKRRKTAHSSEKDDDKKNASEAVNVVELTKNSKNTNGGSADKPSNRQTAEAIVNSDDKKAEGDVKPARKSKTNGNVEETKNDKVLIAKTSEHNKNSKGNKPDGGRLEVSKHSRHTEIGKHKQTDGNTVQLSGRPLNTEVKKNRRLNGDKGKHSKNMKDVNSKRDERLLKDTEHISTVTDNDDERKDTQIDGDTIHISKPSKNLNGRKIQTKLSATELSGERDVKVTDRVTKPKPNIANVRNRNDRHSISRVKPKAKEHLTVQQENSKQQEKDKAFKEGRRGSKTRRRQRKKKGKRVHKDRKVDTDVSTGKKSENKDMKKDDNRQVDSRWNRPGIVPVPDVARLEQQLHPRVDGPAEDIRRALQNILRTFQYTLRKVDRDYRYMFNMTRHDIMVGVRQQLTKLAKSNDEAYDAVIEASLLTKQIYFREHQARRFGYRPSEMAAAATNGASAGSRVSDVDLNPYSSAVNEELKRAIELKTKIDQMARFRDVVVSETMRLQQYIAQRLSARPLHDLARHANRAVELLRVHAIVLDAGNNGNLLSHMKNDTSLSMVKSYKQLQYAEVALQKGRQNLAANRRLRNTLLDTNLRQPAPIRVPSPFNGARMEEWVLVDSASYRAGNLVMEAAKLHMLLKPLIKSAREHMEKTSEQRGHSEMNQLASSILSDIKDLTSVMGSIQNLLGYVPPVTKRPCVQTEGSGAGEGSDTQDEECEEEEEEVEGSGNTSLIDDTEGSGEIDIDDALVGIVLSKVSIEPVIDETDTIVEKEIFIDDDELASFEISGDGPDSSTPSPTTSATPTTTLISKKKKSTAKMKKTTKTPMAIPTTTMTPTKTMAPTTEPSSGVSEEEEDNNAFFDYFNFFNDQPATDRGQDKGIGMKMKLQLTLNEMLRERLSNLSHTSQSLAAPALALKDTVTELGETFDKLNNRVDAVEARTKVSQTSVHKSKAMMAEYRAVHQRVQDVSEDIKFKVPVIQMQASRAEEVAGRKLKVMQEALKTRSDRQTDAPDQGVVTELREAVLTVKANVKEISQLGHVTADPCTHVQMFDFQFRTNISDLRKKVEQAKLIAASLPISVSMKDKGHLRLPVAAAVDRGQSVATSVGAAFKPSEQDGPVLTVKTKDTGSMMFAMSGLKSKFSVLDEDDDELAVQDGVTSLVPGTWYRLVMNRMSNSFNVSVFDAAIGSLVDMVTLAPESMPISQPSPSTVFVGGVTSQFPKYGSRSWDGCVGEVTVNGERLNLLTNDSKDTFPNVCTSLREISQVHDSWIFDGTGYVHFPLDRIMSSRSRVQTISITFNARADGLLLSLQVSSTRTRIIIKVSQGHVEVLVNHANSRSSHVTKEHVLGTNQTIKVRLDGRRTSVQLNGSPDDLEALSSTSRLTYTTDLHGLYVGGTGMEDSSFLGCIQELLLNGKQVQFESLSRGIGVRQGTCQNEACFTLTNASVPIPMTSESSSYIMTFSKDSRGTLIELSRGEKFELIIALDEEGLDIQENVKSSSERLYLENHKPDDHVTVHILDKPDDKEIKVSVGDEYETLSYRSFWGNDARGSSTYNLTIGGADVGDFDRSVTNIVIGYKTLDMSTYAESNKLQRCDFKQFTLPKPSPSPVGASPEIEQRNVCTNATITDQ